MYNEMMDTIGLVNQADPELAAAMNRELNRQREYRLACRHGGHGQHSDQQVRRGPARLRGIFMPCFLCVLHELLWAALCRTQ